MARMTSGRSNMANAGARAKARKASLIDATRMRQLLQQGTDSIGASIGDFGYRSEMDVYSTRMGGSDAIEAALSHNLDNDLDSVLDFCQGNLKGLVAIYVERYHYDKAKTVLRAVHKGASDELIADQILPEENPKNSLWLQIVRTTETVQEAADAMAGSPWGRCLAKLEGEPSLQEMEDALDRQYYANSLVAVRGKDANPQMLRYMRTEIDHRNIINQFRALRQNLSVETRVNLNIPGGRIGDAVLRAATQADSEEALLDALRRSNAFNDSGFEEALLESNESRSLDPVFNLLRNQRLAMLKRFSHLNPVSAFPVIYYIQAKVLEVQNLRLLVRGKAAGLSDEVIEAHLFV
ncbi:MAG: V-type ATPase subunit [Candidatus Thalassarchaeaceae archaeon]|nr:V-type ATPase subunit [Candidatus Thalassarchaeaceae archaeon]